MDTSYLDRINELRNKELDKNWSIQKEQSNPAIKTKQLRDYESGQVEFRRQLTNKRKNYSFKESMNINEDDFQKFNQFHIDKATKCEWKKLNINVKINRLMEYANREKKLHKLNSENVNKLSSLIRTLIDEKILTKGQYIDYNIEEGLIVNIPGLIFEEGKYIFDPTKKIKKKVIKNNKPVIQPEQEQNKNVEIEENLSSNESEENEDHINDQIIETLNTPKKTKKITKKREKKSNENSFISTTKEFKNFMSRNLKAREKLRSRDSSATETI